MPFEHVSPGRPLRISATDWNGAMDAARAAKGGGALPPPTPARPTGSGRSLVKNNSGADIPRFGILGISGAIILPADNLNEFQSRTLFVGAEPTDEHAGKFVVCLQPIADGKLGDCIAMGITTALVDDGDGDFADCSPGVTDHLVRGESGARILWVDSAEADGSPGLYWAYVAVGGGGGGGCDECEEIHEIRVDGSPSGGTLPLTYTINGVTGSAAAITYNSTASAAKTLLLASNAEFTSTNIEVYDGPLPSVALYIRFLDDLAGLRIPLPAVTNSLTGTNVSPKVGRFTSPGF